MCVYHLCLVVLLCVLFFFFSSSIFLVYIIFYLSLSPVIVVPFQHTPFSLPFALIFFLSREVRLISRWWFKCSTNTQRAENIQYIDLNFDFSSAFESLPNLILFDVDLFGWWKDDFWITRPWRLWTCHDDYDSRTWRLCSYKSHAFVVFSGKTETDIMACCHIVHNSRKGHNSHNGYNVTKRNSSWLSNCHSCDRNTLLSRWILSLFCLHALFLCIFLSLVAVLHLCATSWSHHRRQMAAHWKNWWILIERADVTNNQRGQ